MPQHRPQPHTTYFAQPTSRHNAFSHISVADQNPESTFLGLDLSPIQPDYVPPNAQFVVDDVEHENGWDYPENHFDYIHIRHALYSIKDPKGLIERAYR